LTGPEAPSEAGKGPGGLLRLLRLKAYPRAARGFVLPENSQPVVKRRGVNGASAQAPLETFSLLE
jgi:hypothetical protein